MSEFNSTHLEKIMPGLTLFNQQKFWECHEYLEGLWLEDTVDSVRYIYWAVLQVAVALYHVKEKNLEGASNLIKKALDKLQKCTELKVESELLLQKINWIEFKLAVQAIPLNANLNQLKELLNFQFKTDK